MAEYHLFGVISALVFLLTCLGLARQIRTLAAHQASGKGYAQALSVNQFASSFFAFYGVMVLGIALTPFNHYLVWTRFLAVALLLVILFKIMRDRGTLPAQGLFYLASLALLLAIISMFFRPFPGLAVLATNSMIVLVTLVLVQGSVHQLWLLRHRANAGALSLSLFTSILLKDATTLAFAATMPFAQVWPIWLLNGSSLLIRGAIAVRIYQLKHRA